MCSSSTKPVLVIENPHRAGHLVIAAAPLTPIATGLAPACSRCKSYKPPFSHHCRICNRCVSRMDHHCPWMNNCVGAANLKFFILFLLYEWVCNAYALTLLGDNYFLCATEEVSSCHCYCYQAMSLSHRYFTYYGGAVF